MQPRFLVWLAHNPTGIPLRAALGRSLLGMLLAGLVSVLVACGRPVGRRRVQAMPLVGGVIGGGLVGPFAVVFITYRIDRRWFADEGLLGFSGVMRELFHAGELTALGALGGGLGSDSSGIVQGLLIGAFGTSVVGGGVYRLRGLGTGVGSAAGLLSGAVGGLIGATIRSIRQSETTSIGLELTQF